MRNFSTHSAFQKLIDLGKQFLLSGIAEIISLTTSEWNWKVGKSLSLWTFGTFKGLSSSSMEIFSVFQVGKIAEKAVLGVYFRVPN